MQEALPREMAEGFLKGAFDVFEAMLSISFTYSIQAVVPLAEPSVRAYLEEAPVVMRARVPSGGTIALLIPVRQAAQFAALVLGNPPVDKSTLDDSDIATLREIADPSLGGGLTNLMERFGRSIEQPKEITVESTSPDAATDLVAFFDGEPMGAPFQFSAEGMEGAGFFVFSTQLEQLASAAPPPPPPPPAPSANPRAEISNAEMQDILSGFDERSETPESSYNPPREEMPPNIGMVMDIRMVATARLGRIEMPISEILSLGPGSIIQVGHMVDEPVELLVNEKLIARGDVVVVDEKFGLRITEIISAKERIESLH